ncbi:hypothetical protein [Bifidobacterium crudilactis]|jgi:hypothetical protein|uniref:hypothetical protein n=1 Tax=Bifidobacterium crudilactis TaxID=327277 RepID=UPI0026486699|nr:hypothetical protein [Bifidobacterium crudilactis]MDN5973468.1 hypothetical protein [Bifidobacterium crudilactis]MDN6001846.1 hypothetical protein [Bifidobacterium crudilactis]MDN6210432.1 hypothetical protein [Bifidobacterium crudilactis]MDN6271124.1 hypothetical protein [Bifidobacterium crudilactis]MDN6468273.1 hypothetical protein [Bifidobacterium crudilactis]
MTIQTILNLLKTFVTIGGGLWLVWGAIVAGLAMRDHSGPQIQSGIWQIVGGGLIIAAAQMFLNIQV